MTSAARDTRRRAAPALGFNLVALAVAIGLSVLSWDPSDWGGGGLLVVLAGLAIASELLPIELRPRSHPLGGWFFTSSAPFVVAAVCLGPAPALAVAWIGLAASTVAERPPWRDAVANVANYAVFSVVAALLAQGVLARLQIELDEPALAGVAIVTYFVVLATNFAMTASYSALADGERVRSALTNQWFLQLAAEAPIVLTTALAAHMYGTTGLAAVVVLAAVQLLFVHLARELHRSNQRARRVSELSDSRGRLVGQVLDAEESERRRLAAVLHDDAMQSLLSARQDLTDASTEPAVERARRAIDASIVQVRDAIFSLHPVVLDHAGLAVTLESLARAHSRRRGFKARIDVDPVPARLDGLIFSICRELLANAATHASADNVTVHVTRDDETVTVEVADDGRGCEPTSISEAVSVGHIGLATLAERADAMGGTLGITTNRGAGTRVRVVVPLGQSEGASTSARQEIRGPLQPPLEVAALPSARPAT